MASPGQPWGVDRGSDRMVRPPHWGSCRCRRDGASGQRVHPGQRASDGPQRSRHRDHRDRHGNTDEPALLLVRRFGPRVRLPGTREAALKATREFERAAKISLDLSQQQMQTGYANILFLLNAQITYQNAVLARVQAQAARFADTAALFQALGG